MKQYIYAAALLVANVALYAQGDLNTAADAVRYSLDNTTGTARFRGLGGAMGAVGGDLSAMSVNPAGSAIFNYNTGTATGAVYNVKNKANYYGTHTTDKDSSVDMAQVGGVFVFNNANENAFLQKFTLGFNYENSNSFENSLYMAGTSPNSIDQYFLGYANGRGGRPAVSLNTLNTGNYNYMTFAEQQAYLGYNAYVFNPTTDGSNTPYVTNMPQTGNYAQQSRIQNTGYNGKIALNFATQFKQSVYLGINLNIHVTNYVNNISFYEDTNNLSSGGMQELQFDNRRYTYGGGFSLDLGGIVKITEQLRAGLAWKSPTWLRLQDEITQSLYAYCPECDASTSNGNIILDPGMTYILDDYTVRSPGKWTGSLAYIFGKSGLVSVDYALQDFSNTRFSSSRYGYINDELSQTLDMAGELRVGTEWRVKNFSFRGGYRFAQSPYKNGTTVGDLQGYSGGVGISFGDSKLDLAYSWYRRDADVSLLQQGTVDAARVQSTNNNIVLSYTIDL
ncbi:hypothetical protein AM493_19630 [Flavobacterium akiainvivens]|uniref:Transporter n=1 Tax=Flavobacterium akiainvivens TaxID=1202724 RepID=A0A0M8MFU7_9FLAO|nr:hypothetical protein [Flavobacterium akiainvivens]KOS08014.1 hypothetical protein AM493_19630 [Flavobacterium akiainvivens]SFQ61959.1 hypothetical protein SAMN05444144_11071 [Flavobacterium akiainvivens]